MNFFIYTIHNTINNKIYVGKTTDLLKRWNKHIRIAFQNRERERFFIHRSIKKYGLDSFVFSKLQSFSIEKDCNLAEIYWISYFNSTDSNYGYNLTIGGEGCLGRTVSAETKAKMRSKALGRKHTTATKEKLRKFNLGKRRSLESIEKTKQFNLGKTLSNDHKEKISKNSKGKAKHILSKEKVVEVRRLYEEAGLSQTDISEFLGIKVSNVSSIVTYRTWKNLNWRQSKVGENNKLSKLTCAMILDIRSKYKSGKYSYRQLSKMFDVCKTTIENIIHRKKWKHI